MNHADRLEDKNISKVPFTATSTIHELYLIFNIKIIM